MPSIRACAPEDVAAVQAIYAHHVSHGLGSFEELPPSVDEMARRRETVLGRGLPWLVAELDGVVAGYAYAGPYHTRPAYRWTVENSVYVAHDMAGRGVGRALLAALIEACTALGYRQMVAIIGDSGNAASLALHAALGFSACGGFKSVGFKHGRWVDISFMQLALGSGDASAPALRVARS